MAGGVFFYVYCRMMVKTRCFLLAEAIFLLTERTEQIINLLPCAHSRTEGIKDKTYESF